MKTDIATRRAAELAALFAVGDGLTTALFPREQMRFWKGGPRIWQRVLDPFERHPQMTRLFALGQAGAALFIARRLMKSGDAGG